MPTALVLLGHADPGSFNHRLAGAYADGFTAAGGAVERLDLTALRFDPVLRHGSFTAAARALATEQSTVSRRIAGLEAALGVALFERGRRAPTPTEAALRLRPAAERVEAEIGQLIDAAAEPRPGAVRGRVRVATTDELAAHVLVPRALPGLRAAHPELTVELVTSYAGNTQTR